MADRRVTFLIGANIKNFTDNLGKAQKQFKKFGDSLTSVGKTLTTRVTAPLALAGGASIKLAIDFEKSMSKIEGLVGVAATEVNAMKQSVLNLSGPTSKAPGELADALFFVTSAGLRGKDALDVLEKSAKAAASGLGETKVVADLVTSAVNAYGINNLSAANATDVLVAAVREGKAEAPALAESMGQVLPIASNMGVSFDQVGAAIAAMTRTGTDAGTASIQLRQILASLLKPTRESEEALHEMGVSSMQLRKQLKNEGLVSVLGFLAEQMKTNEQAMAKVFPNIRALSGALDIMGSNASENVGIFSRMTDTTGSLDKAFDSASKTASFKFNQAMAQLKTAAIELGNLLLPVFLDIVNAVKGVVKWFTSLDKSTKILITVIGGFAAAIGPVLTILGGIATAIGAISAPVLGVVAAIVALGSAILYIADNWDAIRARISDWSWWKNVLIDMAVFVIKYNPMQLLLKPIEAILSKLGVEVPNAFDMVAEKLLDMKDAPGDAYPPFKNFFDSVIGKAKETITALTGIGSAIGLGSGLESSTSSGTSTPNQKAPVSPALSPVSLGSTFSGTELIDSIGESMDMIAVKGLNLDSVIQGLQESFRGAWQAGEMFGNRLGESLGAMFQSTGKGIKDLANTVIDAIKQIIAAFLAKALAAAIANAFASSGNPLIGAVLAAAATGLVFGLFNSIPAFAKGGTVPSGYPNDSYPAMLTSGETVLPDPIPLSSGGGMGNLVARIEGSDLLFVVEEEQRKRGNT